MRAAAALLLALTALGEPGLGKRLPFCSLLLLRQPCCAAVLLRLWPRALRPGRPQPECCLHSPLPPGSARASRDLLDGGYGSSYAPSYMPPASYAPSKKVGGLPGRGAAGRGRRRKVRRRRRFGASPATQSSVLGLVCENRLARPPLVPNNLGRRRGLAGAAAAAVSRPTASQLPPSHGRRSAHPSTHPPRRSPSAPAPSPRSAGEPEQSWVGQVWGIVLSNG